MKASQVSEVAFLLKRLVTDYSRILLNHPWPTEHDRWVELVFALVARVVKKRESEVRRAIQRLDALDLIVVDELAQMPTINDSVDVNGTVARRIYEALSESPIGQDEKLFSEFSDEEAKDSIQIMHEAAKGLAAHNNGKVQKYLRSYGERMLAEIPDHFTFSKLSRPDVRQAFAYWFQNVLSMPVILADSRLEEFCREHGITVEVLIREADDQNLNIGLMDDLIEQYMSEREKRNGRKTAGS